MIAPNWLKPVRLSSLGKDYSREAILRRLQSQREDKYFVDFYTPKSYYQRQPLIVRIRDFEKRTEPDVITSLFDLIITIAKLITGNNVQKRDCRPVSPDLDWKYRISTERWKNTISSVTTTWNAQRILYLAERKSPSKSKPMKPSGSISVTEYAERKHPKKIIL